MECRGQAPHSDIEAPKEFQGTKLQFWAFKVLNFSGCWCLGFGLFNRFGFPFALRSFETDGIL
jgi:hypothetical protein